MIVPTLTLPDWLAQLLPGFTWGDEVATETAADGTVLASYVEGSYRALHLTIAQRCGQWKGSLVHTGGLDNLPHRTTHTAISLPVVIQQVRQELHGRAALFLQALAPTGGAS